MDHMEEDRMTSTEFVLAEQAEEYVATRFARLRPASKKLAAFRTAHGKHFALARERKDAIYFWAEMYDGDIEGIEVNNVKRPGQPYGPEQPRSSALSSHCSQLGLGNSAYYLRSETLGALERFVEWYAKA